MHNSSVHNFCKYFSLGNFWIKYNWTADVFPISHQWKDISVYHPYVQYILIHATNKMPCSGSWLKYQHLQSDACNSDGYFMCKYCSNSVLFFVPARLFSRPSFWCSVWWCQKTFCHVPPLARLWYMIDKQLRHDQLCLFFVDHNQTTLGLIGNLSGKCYGTKYNTVTMLCIGTLLLFVTFLDPCLLYRL